jgi:hypothetical protein
LIEAGARSTAGAWTKSLLPEIAGIAARDAAGDGVVCAARARAFAPGRFPVFLIEPAPIYYGFPPFGAGITTAMKPSPTHNYDRAVSATRGLIRAALADFPPQTGPWSKETCPHHDAGRLIDRLPGAPGIVASPCSGHGFAPAIGEILAIWRPQARPATTSRFHQRFG